MSFINSREKEINCKLAYYGAPFSGKSTSLHYIYEKTATNRRGKIVSLSDEGGALYFDFLPLSLGKVDGYTVRFHLYTIPGQALYNSSRTVILKGLDGLVFVADSQIERLDDNVESWKMLQTNLKNNGIDAQNLPIIFQYNKRDKANVLPVSELNSLFNNRQMPEFETVATQGLNVLECFQAAAKKVLLDLKR